MMKSFFLTALFAVLYFYVPAQTDKNVANAQAWADSRAMLLNLRR